MLIVRVVVMTVVHFFLIIVKFKINYVTSIGRVYYFFLLKNQGVLYCYLLELIKVSRHYKRRREFTYDESVRAHI